MSSWNDYLNDSDYYCNSDSSPDLDDDQGACSVTDNNCVCCCCQSQQDIVNSICDDKKKEIKEKYKLQEPKSFGNQNNFVQLISNSDQISETQNRNGITDEIKSIS